METFLELYRSERERNPNRLIVIVAPSSGAAVTFFDTAIIVSRLMGRDTHILRNVRMLTVSIFDVICHLEEIVRHGHGIILVPAEVEHIECPLGLLEVPGVAGKEKV